MRFSPILILAIVATCFVSTANAQRNTSSQERMSARLDLERAKTDLLYYWQYEYPRKRRELDAAIEITRAEIDNNNALLREYRPFTSFSIGQPFPITIRNVQMCIKAGELRLNDLIAERNFLIRFRGDEFRELSAQVQAARVRVAELEADMEIPAQSEEQLPLQR